MTYSRSPMQQSPQRNAPVTGGRDVHWFATTNVRFTGGDAAISAWTMPAPYWRDVRGFLTGHVLFTIDGLDTNVTGATVDIIIETAVVNSDSSGAWRPVERFTVEASFVGHSWLIPARLNASEGKVPLLGWLRISMVASGTGVLTASTDWTQISFRSSLVLKQPVPYRAIEWFAGRMSLTADTPFTLPLDMAADVSQFLNVYVAAQFDPDLAATSINLVLDSAVSYLPSFIWPLLTPTSPSIPDGDNHTVVLTALRGLQLPPPSGLLRFLAFISTESTTPANGFLQMWLLLKQT